ncbi:MAG: response regulator [Desulfuromonadaceae bacterium]|nr:response regulator [Desulfuromonadaceae bacterium]MDD2856953.1 response regulator [Desulfuromonadaceae bacterium]
MSRTVMIVDDSLFMRKILRGILVENGYIVTSEASSGIEAMRNLHSNHPDLIILDIILPDSNGLELLESIIAASPESKVVVCSSIGQEQVIQKSLDLGAKSFIQKPFTPEKVTEVLESLED